MSVQRPILEAFDRVLLREAHNLTRWPELLWQQLYNELQFERESVVATLAPELARRTAVGAPPWLWRRTPLGQSGALLATLPGHDHGWINYCAISPEGSYVVAGFADGTLKLWDPATGAELQTFGSRFGVWGCAVAPDGSYVVASTEDRKLKLWDPAAGTLLRTLGGDETPLIGCAVSPDGSFVASGGFDGILRLWDPTTGEELGRVGARGSLVTVQAVAPDASYIVAAGEDAPLRLWDPSSGALLQAFGGESAGQHCAVAPDGSYVVSAGGQTLRLLDPASGEERRTLAAGPFTDCAVSPDGAFVVSTSMDSTVRLWDPASGEEVATLTGHGTGHGSEAMCCAVSPDGSYLVSGGKDRTLRVWARPTGQTVGAGGGALRGMVGACAVSPDGSYVVSAGGRTLRLSDLATGRERGSIQTQWDPASAMNFIEVCAVSPDGSYVVSATQDGIVKLWDPVSLRELRTLARYEGRLHDCAVSPDGSFIVAGGDGESYREDGSPVSVGRVTIWDPASGEELRSLGHANRVDACAVSADGSYIVSAGHDMLSQSDRTDSSLKLWDPVTGEELRTLGGGAQACAVSPDGAYIVAAGSGNRLKLWDPATGEELRTLDGGGIDLIEDCAVSPDGAHIVSVGFDGLLRVWDAASGRQVALLPLPGRLPCVALHPSQPLAACGDTLGAVNIVEFLASTGPRRVDLDPAVTFAG